MHAQALKEMTIIRVYHRAAPREVGQDGNPVFSDAELPGLCIVAGRILLSISSRLLLRRYRNHRSITLATNPGNILPVKPGSGVLLASQRSGARSAKPDGFHRTPRRGRCKRSRNQASGKGGNLLALRRGKSVGSRYCVLAPSLSSKA